MHGNFIDLTGIKFGKVTVLEFSHRNTKTYWNCVCDCGKKFIARGDYLKSSNTLANCGCSSRLDLTGKKFGKLTAISYAGANKYGQSVWRCVCECNPNTVLEKTIIATRLNNGYTQSCGCGHGFEEGTASFNSLYKRYKNNAKRGGRTFQIDKQDFKHLTSQNCSYCDRKPASIIAEKNCKGVYVYNGIDRVDNTKGYIPDNVVACCASCNISKKDVSPEIMVKALQFLGYNIIKPS